MFTTDRSPLARSRSGALAALLGGGLALLAALPLSAGTNAAAVQALRDKQEQKEQKAQSAESAPAPRREARREERREERRDDRRDDRRDEAGPQQGRSTFRAAPGQAPMPAQALSPYGSGYRNRNGDPVVVGPPRGRQGPDARIVAPSRAYGYNRPPPPSRVVPRLPPGYRSYNWGGSPYYQHGGHWYRPYGGSYALIGAPFGLFVPYLPSYYTTLWIGGTRYYVADDTYYLYEPQRRGYVVARSPYQDSDEDEEGGDEQPAKDLYIYPTRGQSEQQQSDDRYECHRWGVGQAHYDPTEAEYRAEAREQYDRAVTACLTGRGYSVK